MTTNAIPRWATEADHAVLAPVLADVMFDAVRNGPSRYTERQRQQWVPRRRAGVEWKDRLARQAIVLAEQPSLPATLPDVLGFMSLAAGGYIDFAYLRPRARGTGLFRRLYVLVEDRGVAQGEARLWVHASLMAEPAFAALGFAVVERQVVTIGDQGFERCLMEKRLGSSAG